MFVITYFYSMLGIDMVLSFYIMSSKVEEPLLRNSRCRQLWDKWHSVWLMAWERQRRLQEHLNYLREVEKVRNFSWDIWRKRVCLY